MRDEIFDINTIEICKPFSIKCNIHILIQLHHTYLRQSFLETTFKLKLSFTRVIQYFYFDINRMFHIICAPCVLKNV